MAFLGLDYKGIAFFDNTEVKFEQVPESHGELLNRNFRASPHVS